MCNDVSICLKRFLAMSADTCDQGCAPSGRSAKNLCHKVWTAQLFTPPPLQEHLRFKMPLPFGRFFRRSMRRHTVSPPSHMMVCSLEAPGLSGRILQIGSACGRYQLKGGNCTTHAVRQGLPQMAIAARPCMRLATASQTVSPPIAAAQPAPCW